MQKNYEIDQDMLVLLLIVLGVGILFGVMIARAGKRTASPMDDKKRASANFVFGNIVVGSNNGRGNRQSFRLEDSGDND